MFGWLRRSCCQNLVAEGGGCRCVNSAVNSYCGRRAELLLDVGNR
ncbi:hypothetical protein RchiOBHm_Chr7g0206241 [Rosa chinensis]|uniref:Uncharacterized protein n=1 Tax=Rosa chinensis TaxID=74649 RepID=A0A2P6P976_ROSCH|nr:hypothetical protein RchiOBHm_Chr7g0206241 [Rosa chinensis]